MDQLNNPTSVYSIFDKPGDYWEITKKEYELIIDNEFSFTSTIEIIIPTYKRPKLMIEALNSALNQDVDFNYLITIIDNDPDSSNKNLLNKKEYKNRIRYIRNKENLGLFGNWNRAIQVSRAPFIALLHDDDMLETNYISTLLKVIDRYPDLGVVTHVPFTLIGDKRINPFNSMRKKLRISSVYRVSWKDYLYGNITNASCMLINKEKAININGWCSNEFPSADWFFNSRIAFNYSLLNLQKPISSYRWSVNESLNPKTKIEFHNKDAFYLLNNLRELKNEISFLDSILISIVIVDNIKKIDDLDKVIFRESVKDHRLIKNLFRMEKNLFIFMYILAKIIIRFKIYFAAILNSQYI